MPDDVGEIYRRESRRVLATLIRLLGDFDLAEEAMHDAFVAALERWPRDGIPGNPRAWLVSTGRHKGIDAIRRRARPIEIDLDQPEPHELEDDQLRLVFTCCHPALQPDAQIALTLREVCGLTTEAIAQAFLTRPATIAQRIVRAKQKIRDARIPYAVPERPDLPERLATVLRTIYLVFNEGYSALNAELSAEAIRLGRELAVLLPEPEVSGLLALMLLHESRRHARSTPAGDIVLLEDQDRSRWNHAMIAEGRSLVDGARQFGPYMVQAAIAALHTADETDWPEIVGLYDVLLRLEPSPVVELNRAVAIAMRDGPEAGLALVDRLLGVLGDYQFAHAARAELCARLGRRDEAVAAWERALGLATTEPDRRFLRRRLGVWKEDGTPAS